jgi:hypothetical protein
MDSTGSGGSPCRKTWRHYEFVIQTSARQQVAIGSFRMFRGVECHPTGRPRANEMSSQPIAFTEGVGTGTPFSDERCGVIMPGDSHPYRRGTAMFDSHV